MNKPFIITIVGAESSGKTTLAMELAEHFQCPWIPEYAREYLAGLDRLYGERDLEIIAERQLEEILKVVNRQQLAIGNRQLAMESSLPLDLTEGIRSKIQNLNSKILIVDGGMMNLRMWSKIKYKKNITIVEEVLEEDMTDLYLLCRPYKEWTHDPLREAPDLLDRVWIYNQYLKELVNGMYAMEIVDGSKDQRLEMAINIILQLKTIL